MIPSTRERHLVSSFVVPRGVRTTTVVPHPLPHRGAEARYPAWYTSPRGMLSPYVGSSSVTH